MQVILGQAAEDSRGQKQKKYSSRPVVDEPGWHRALWGSFQSGVIFAMMSSKLHPHSYIDIYVVS